MAIILSLLELFIEARCKLCEHKKVRALEASVLPTCFIVLEVDCLHNHKVVPVN